jgi:hypothetical protein
MHKIVLTGLVSMLTGMAAMAQATFKEMMPDDVRTLNLSPEAEAQFKRDNAAASAVYAKLRDGAKESDLTAEEQRILKHGEETDGIEDYWDILGPGCSWYCGGGADSITASSTLRPQGSVSYEARHAEDLSYKTAWAEGVPGYGIGEYLLYMFRPATPRITAIIVVNGYVKSEKAYSENSRVKKLNVYLNDRPYATPNLEDKRSSQYFEITPLGRDNNDKTPLLPWLLKFEIADVYKGTKYDDTVISEIYFDGIDVH